MEGENRTLVSRATVARSAIKLHPPSKPTVLYPSTDFFLLLLTEVLISKPAVSFNLIKQDIKIFLFKSEKAQLKKSEILFMGTTPKFNCHSFITKKKFLNIFICNFLIDRKVHRKNSNITINIHLSKSIKNKIILLKESLDFGTLIHCLLHL